MSKFKNKVLYQLWRWTNGKRSNGETIRIPAGVQK